MPLGSIILELTLIVLLPTVIGVSLRTKFSAFFARHDSAYAGIGSILYLLILLAVVGPNATTIIGYGWYAFVIPAAFFAVIQMITSPIAAKILARH